MSSTIRTLLMVVIGAFIYSLGLNMFYIPHNLLSGGVSGIAIIIYYLTDVPIGISNILINIPIIMLAIKYLGKRFTLISIFGVFVTSAAIDMFAYLSNQPFIHDPILSAAFGGVLIGVGSGLMYRYEGSGGGTDIIAAIVKKFYSIEMGSMNFVMNAALMAVSAYIFNLELAVLTLAGMYIQSAMTNKVVVGLNQRKTAHIVSVRGEEIADAIMREVGRGVTILHGVGAYSKRGTKIIFVVINLTQVAKIKSIVQNIDPNAFLFITPTADVMGGGFSKPKDRPLLLLPAAPDFTAREVIDEAEKDKN